MGAIKINGETSGSTTITAPATGSDETIELSTALASKLDLAGGKILQIVRATDSSDRTTTSTSMVDANISVTITPQKSDSAVLLLWAAESNTGATNAEYLRRQITDNSNNAISGAELATFGSSGNGTRDNGFVIAYATPATTSATTYKGRFRSNGGTSVTLANAANTGQMYALEISA